MSRRGRAIAFAAMALAAAAIAAGIADGYGSRVARSYGALRPVVVAGTDLAAGRVLGPQQVSTVLEVRRVPGRFIPPGALAAPVEALGLAPRSAIPAGSYLLAAQLHTPGGPAARPVGLGPRLHPVEISVSGADALLAAGPPRPGMRVDVVVTTESGAGSSGRAFVAAPAVPLLSLGGGADGPGSGGLSVATLGLSRRQALRLIAAESFARQITLLPRG
jgi:Flp pilus assembly protein CpaB